MGIITCYSAYAYLQEDLLADKSKKINVSLVISIQAGTAVAISSAIIKFFGMGSLWGSLN